MKGNILFSVIIVSQFISSFNQQICAVRHSDTGHQRGGGEGGGDTPHRAARRLPIMKKRGAWEGGYERKNSGGGMGWR